MSNETLQQQLQQLHDTLTQTSELNAEQESLLRQLAQDIEQLSPASTDLGSRVQQQAVQLEEEFPITASVLRQVLETLGKMGV